MQIMDHSLTKTSDWLMKLSKGTALYLPLQHAALCGKVGGNEDFGSKKTFLLKKAGRSMRGLGP